MSGMGSGFQTGNSTMVAAFRAALIHQGIFIAVIFALPIVGWISFREWLPATRAGNSGKAGSAGSALAEPAARLAAWTGDGGAHWTLAPPLSLSDAQVRSSGLGAGGAVWLTLSSGRAETISGSGWSWRALPALPVGTAGLTLGSSGQVDALATHSTKLTDWRLDVRATAWHVDQIINVPIQFGSSS